MSWAEIKRAVNSDIDVPLNLILHINDLKIFGTSSYVWNDDKLALRVFESVYTEIDHVLFNLPWINRFAAKNKNMGVIFKKIAGSTNSVFNSLDTIAQVLNNSTAMGILADNKKALVDMYLSANLFEPVILSSTIAKNALSNSKFKVTKSTSISATYDTEFEIYPQPAFVISTYGQYPSTTTGAGKYVLSPYNIPQTATTQNVYRFATKVTSSRSSTSTYTHYATIIPLFE